MVTLAQDSESNASQRERVLSLGQAPDEEASLWQGWPKTEDKLQIGEKKSQTECYIKKKELFFFLYGHGALYKRLGESIPVFYRNWRAAHLTPTHSSGPHLFRTSPSHPSPFWNILPPRESLSLIGSLLPRGPRTFQAGRPGTANISI